MYYLAYLVLQKVLIIVDIHIRIHFMFILKLYSFGILVSNRAAIRKQILRHVMNKLIPCKQFRHNIYVSQS
jgi:hypothetical protein